MNTIETIKLGEEGINNLFNDEIASSYLEVDNGEETLTPEDNNGMATIELYEDNDRQNPIWTNQPKYPETISLVWGIGDFEGKAQELEEIYPDNGDQYTDENPMLYDRSKFGEALQLMERRHDCNYGVTWETVEYFLNEYCRL